MGKTYSVYTLMLETWARTSWQTQMRVSHLLVFWTGAGEEESFLENTCSCSSSLRVHTQRTLVGQPTLPHLLVGAGDSRVCR